MTRKDMLRAPGLQDFTNYYNIGSKVSFPDFCFKDCFNGLLEKL